MDKRFALIGLPIMLIGLFFLSTGCDKTPTITTPGIVYTSVGQEIYYSGVNEDRIIIGDGTGADACDNCHGPVGRGDTIFIDKLPLAVPPLIWSYLTTANENRPAYDTAKVKRAITQAIDSAGNPMTHMHAIQMSDKDLNDLFKYLKSLH
jgi:hypothetical protein